MVSLESTGFLIQFAQQLGAVLNEDRQICLNSAPDNAITHVEVLMGEQVTKINDLAPFRDGRKQPRVAPGNQGPTYLFQLRFGLDPL